MDDLAPQDLTVRRASAADRPAVRSIAAAAWRDSYAGILRPETIESFIERAYAEERVAARIHENHLFVAEDPDRVVAFADAIERDDRLELVAIYALPSERRRGAGTALRIRLLELFPERDISADVVEGNRKGESFYEHRGFEPRERIETSLFGEPVVERRWWRPAGTR